MHSARGRYLGQTWPCDKKRAGYLDVSRAQGTPKGTLHAAKYQIVRNSIRRPESTPRIMPPECFTQNSIVPNVQPQTQVISPALTTSRLTQCSPPEEAASNRKHPVEVCKCVCTTTRDDIRSRSQEVSTRRARAHSLLWIFDTLDTVGSGCVSRC